MKPEARIFEITSPKRKISLNYHLNKFPELKYCLWYAECESITYLLLIIISVVFAFHVVPASCIVSLEQARCSRRGQNTDLDNRKPLKMANTIPKATRYENKWAAHIFESYFTL